MGVKFHMLLYISNLNAIVLISLVYIAISYFLNFEYILLRDNLNIVNWKAMTGTIIHEFQF